MQARSWWRGLFPCTVQSMSVALASKLFSNDAFSVDILQCGCKLYFRAADVTRALGYGNSSQAVRKNVRDKHVYTRGALDGSQGGISRGEGGVSPAERGGEIPLRTTQSSTCPSRDSMNFFCDLESRKQRLFKIGCARRYCPN